MHKHMDISRKKLVSVAAVLALGVLMYLAGAGTAMKVNEMKGATLETSTGENWGLGFGAEGQTPTGTKTAEELKKMDAYYVGDTTEKVLYLTFDAGYENGNTGKILDALKKHNAPEIGRAHV